MDSGISTIIASGMASLASLIVFIASNIFTRMNTDKPSKVRIYERQLFRVFTPLEILLDKNGSDVTPELLRELKRIIYANYTMIPDTLLSEYKKLADPLLDKEYKTFVLRDIVSTYYNLRKKELGYPFKSSAINAPCLNFNERTAMLKESFKSSAFLAFIFFASTAAAACLSVIIGKELQQLIVVLIVTYLVFTIGLWLNKAPSFTKKGLLYRKAYEKSKKRPKISKGKGIFSKIGRKFVKRKPTEKNIGQYKL